MGFHLLHGDMKISNIVYDKKPKLIDLEFLRYGPAEIELSNFCVQLLGMHEASDEPVLHFLRQIWSCADCFGDIDYDIVFKLGIPLFMFFRMKYAAAGRIGSADKILKSYPVLWEKYKVIVL